MKWCIITVELWVVLLHDVPVLYRILAKSKDTDENPKAGKNCSPNLNSVPVSSDAFYSMVVSIIFALTKALLFVFFINFKILKYKYLRRLGLKIIQISDYIWLCKYINQ